MEQLTMPSIGGNEEKQTQLLNTAGGSLEIVWQSLIKISICSYYNSEIPLQAKKLEQMCLYECNMS